jgi:hypothetical protein
LTARTIPAFTSCFFTLGVVFDTDICVLQGDYRENRSQDATRLEQILRKQARALATMSVLDLRFKAFPCSLMASAILYVSRRSLGLPTDLIWPDRLIDMTSYSVDDLSVVVRLLDSTSHEISQWLANSRSAAALATPAVVSTVSNTPDKSGIDYSKESHRSDILVHLKSESDETYSPASIADSAMHQTEVANPPQLTVLKRSVFLNKDTTSKV